VGEIAVVYDRQDRFLAFGLYDPESPIQLRILHHGKPIQIDEAFWRLRLDTAFAKRVDSFDHNTNGFRLVSGESDGWPGLVIDRYGDTLVLKLYSASWLGSLTANPTSLGKIPSLPHLRLIPLILACASQSLGIAEANLRLVLRLSRNIQDDAAHLRLQDGQNLAGTDVSESVIFREHGLRFESDVVRGQKTGFFLDQRENRRQVGEWAANADVLNAFSFSGGFSLYAARGGARTVTDLDISPHALDAARRNFALNQEVPGVQAARHAQVQAEAFAWLESSNQRDYSLVILDPPSLAKRESEREGAIRAYERLAFAGLQRTRPGGILLCASCSAHVSEEEFFNAVRRAIARKGGKAQELQRALHAVDHPATFPEARYLKAMYVRVET
jgi:23S rRNA (cytosine1962-C5)-methyltransferase